MRRRMKPKRLIIVLLMTILVFGSAFSVTFVMKRIEAAEPTESIANPKPRPRAWEARQKAAEQRSAEVIPLVKKVLEETPTQRRARLGGELPRLDDMDFTYFLLNNPILKGEENVYGTVRFMHKKHAGILKDCFICHHHRPADLDASETYRCSACHQKPFNPGLPDRIGLKGAHHRQCMGCHKKWDKGPVGCTECHTRNVPDHGRLVTLSENPKPTDVTKECIRCHQTQAVEMLTSTHWLWKGPSAFTEGYENRVELGKATKTVNNFLIHIASNWPRCTACHAGYGWQDNTFDFTEKTRIDCLVCHDTTKTYRKAPRGAGMPESEVDLVYVAKNVGKPSRQTCGACHFASAGEDPVKHGKLNPFLDFHSSSSDIHMGGLGFQCHDCHKTRNHKISGRSLALPVAEGSRSCEDCHTVLPHQGRALLNHHLNRHSEHIACTTCHNPFYAKFNPTKTFWDWSVSGDKKRSVKKDKDGMPDYNWKMGEFTWRKRVKPVYAWYNGKVKRYLLGDKIKDEGVTVLTEPLGGMKDSKSKIYPFKFMGGRQAADVEHNYLLVPHLFGPDGYWETLDWQKAFVDGMKAAGLPYSGRYKWVNTLMYIGLNHEVFPKKFALSCVQCHSSLKTEKSCGRCHQDKREVDFKKMAFSNIDFKLLHGTGPEDEKWAASTYYIGFENLGYKGDPIIYGGRFKQLPLGWRPISQKK